MSVEFSGQITRSGCVHGAGGDVGGEALGLGHVVLQDLPRARRGSPARLPGTLPCTTAAVTSRAAVGPGPRSAAARARRRCRSRRRRRGRPTASRGSAPRQSTTKASSAPTRAIAKVTERRAAEGGVGRQRGGGLAEGEPAPGEAAERHPVADRLGEHPHEPARPAATRRSREVAATPAPTSATSEGERPGQQPARRRRRSRASRRGAAAGTRARRGSPARGPRRARTPCHDSVMSASAGGASHTRSYGGNDSTSSAPPSSEPRTRQSNRGGRPVRASDMRPGYGSGQVAEGGHAAYDERARAGVPGADPSARDPSHAGAAPRSSAARTPACVRCADDRRARRPSVRRAGVRASGPPRTKRGQSVVSSGTV